MPSTVRGNEYPTCHNFNKGFSCARTPCPYAHRCNKQGCVGITPGSGALLPLNQKSSHLHGLGSPTVSTIAPATVASNFGGVITPVNVFNLQCALHSNPTGHLLINCAWNWGKELGSASRVLGSFVSQGIYLMPPLILFHLSALFPKSTHTTISSVHPQNRDHQYKPFYRQGWFFPSIHHYW